MDWKGPPFESAQKKHSQTQEEQLQSYHSHSCPNCLFKATNSHYIPPSQSNSQNSNQPMTPKASLVQPPKAPAGSRTDPTAQVAIGRAHCRNARSFDRADRTPNLAKMWSDSYLFGRKITTLRPYQPPLSLFERLNLHVKKSEGTTRVWTQIRKHEGLQMDVFVAFCCNLWS